MLVLVLVPSAALVWAGLRCFRCAVRAGSLRWVQVTWNGEQQIGWLSGPISQSDAVYLCESSNHHKYDPNHSSRDLDQDRRVTAGSYTLFHVWERQIKTLGNILFEIDLQSQLEETWWRSLVQPKTEQLIKVSIQLWIEQRSIFSVKREKTRSANVPSYVRI